MAQVAVTHYRDMLDFYPDAKGVRFARKHLAGYCTSAGLSQGDPLRQTICKSLDPLEVETALLCAFDRKREAA